MADFYQVLIKMNMASEHGGVPTFMSTHPDPGDRYNAVNRDASRWQDSLDLTAWQVNADNYLNLIDGMVFGEDPRQGFVEGQMFYHPELKFEFPVPAGWTLQNSPMQVSMSPADGKALMIFTLAQQNSLEDAVTVTLQDLGLTPFERNQISVNGMPAVSVVSSQTSQNQSTGQQQTIKILSLFINYSGTNYVFHGLSAEADFDNYRPVFEPAMRNFDKLTDPSKLNVQPKRIRIREVERAGSLADVLRSFGVRQEQMEEFAFLNNMELADRLPAGALIKTVED
jgi:predicted Zn-dependent protease